MKKILVTLLTVIMAGTLSFHAGAQTLDLKWKTDTLLRVPESVLFDASKNILYVACIDGKPDGKDGVGSIAKVSPTGKIEKLNWVTGLDAPKGMGLYKNTLYVADISAVDVIDIATGKVTAKVEIEGAVFLNDITVDKKGNVYTSDTRTGKIYVLKNNKPELYFESKELQGVNGLLALPDGSLYVLDFATGFNYKLSADKKLTKFGETAQGADGVVWADKDGYLVSSWHGEVYYVNAQGQSQKLLDTKDQKVSAADIEFDPKSKTLYVPTFFSNSVVAYTLKK
jgi:DNA-binding beta-propeller fold protein YncE